MGMLCTAEIYMADTVSESDLADFLTNSTWAVCSTYHTVLIALPGAAIFGRDMILDVPFIAYWNKIGDDRQSQTIATQDVKTKHLSTGIIKLAIKYLCVKMAVSVKQKADMTVILGPSHQFIRMEQSRFNAEQNQNV